MAFSIGSQAFAADQPIPRRFTCDGDDVSPALSWADPPAGAQAFALIVDDPDAPGGDFTHWVIYNLAADARELPENVAKAERPGIAALQGRNDFGRAGYGGPCPPSGRAHHYRFTLYALDGPLDLSPGTTKQHLLDAMDGHVLGEARLVGTYER